MIVIEEHRVCLQFLTQKNCAEFSNTKAKLLLDCRQVSWVQQMLYFNPL